MKPRLLIILNRLVIGGQSIDTIPLALALKDQFDILVVYGEKEADELEYDEALSHRGEISFLKIASLKRSLNPLNDIAAFFRLKKVVKDFRPDVVHTHGSKPGLTGRPAAWFGGVKVILHTMHGHVFHSYYNRFVSGVIIRIERLLGRITTKIVVLSDEQQADIAGRYKIVPPGKTALIPLGIDEAWLLRDAATLRQQFREKYQVSPEETAICIIGRMGPVKNHRLFIDTVIAMRQQAVPRTRFFVVGDGILKKALQHRLDEAGITWSDGPENAVATVIFTSWVTPITSVLHGMDIVTLTSLNEGTPVSIIEAQMCSIPVVAVNVGGVKDTLLENASGYLLKEHSAVQFSEALGKLAGDPVLRAQMGAKGYTFVRQKYSKQKEVEAFRALYTSAIANSIKN